MALTCQPCFDHVQKNSSTQYRVVMEEQATKLNNVVVMSTRNTIANVLQMV